MWCQATGKVLLMLGLACLQGCNSRFQALWSGTKISESWISTPPLIYETTPVTKTHHVGVVCGMRDWCHTFCPDYNGSSHLLSLLSVPGNEDPKGPPWVDCYTDRPRDNFLTAQSGVTVYSATAPYYNRPNREPSNLLDGVAGVMDDCYASENISYPLPHIVFDLGSVRNVNDVSIFSQPNDLGEKYFFDMDVRVGMTAATGNFEENGYKRLGFYKGPVQAPAFEFRTDSPKPIAGQYISIQSLSSPMLQIYHVEIY